MNSRHLGSALALVLFAAPAFAENPFSISRPGPGVIRVQQKGKPHKEYKFENNRSGGRWQTSVSDDSGSGTFVYDPNEGTIDINAGFGKKFKVEWSKHGDVIVGDDRCNAREKPTCVADILARRLNGVSIEGILALRNAAGDYLEGDLDPDGRIGRNFDLAIEQLTPRDGAR